MLHVGAFGDGGPVVEGSVVLDVQAKAGQTIGGLQGDLEACGRALVALQDAADLAVDLGGIQPLGRAVDAGGKLGQRRLDALAELIVHGLLLLRRSAERRRIAVSQVSGQRASLISMPSRIARQPLVEASAAASLRSSALGAPMM
jgi:hypothetical protein